MFFVLNFEELEISEFLLIDAVVTVLFHLLKVFANLDLKYRRSSINHLHDP